MNFAEELLKAAQRTTGNNVFNAAEATKAELDKLGAEIARRNDCILLTAPIKGRERAEEKVHSEKGGGDWFTLKDVARITLVPRVPLQLDATPRLGEVVAVLEKLMSNVNVYGYAKVKGEETKADVDACGYSGFNYVLRFGSGPVDAVTAVDRAMGGIPAPASYTMQPLALKEEQIDPILKQADILNNHSIGLGADAAGIKNRNDPRLQKIQLGYAGRYGEIQVNTLQMMYAKMSVQSFLKLFGAQQYMRCMAEFGVDGGLGHLFYEHWRSAPGAPRGVEAAALSKRYYRRLRNEEHPRPPRNNDALKRDLVAYIKRWGAH
jgi:hypothetical protein